MDWNELAEVALIGGAILVITGAGTLLAHLLLNRKANP